MSIKRDRQANDDESINFKGFTIVELLVVIVVIGILAAISFVSYGGLTNKAVAVSLQSDLTNSSDQLKIYKAYNKTFPTSLDGDNCPLLPVKDTGYCLEASSNNTYTKYTSNGSTFSLVETNANGTSYIVTDDQLPQLNVSLAVSDPANWFTIGTQVWAKTNLNAGTIITGTTEQTNNSILEKYCYGNLESNCTTYGGLYQWNEVMQYVTTEGARGMCPGGSHVPSDNDWKILEVQLGMTQIQADATDWRGTDQGTQIKSGGLSGLNISLAGYRFTNGSFYFLTSDGFLWSSSKPSTNAWSRYLYSGRTTVGRDTYDNANGCSVRCMGN